MRILLNCILIFATIFCGIDSASAKNWPTVGWFDIVQLDDGCAITSDYSFDGRSDVKLALIFNEGEAAVLMVNSFDWSAKHGVEYPGITYTLNGFVYSDIKDDEGKLLLATKGNTFDGVYKGFIRAFPAGFLEDFAKGDSLLIENGDNVITHVNLRSSGAAVSKLRECAAYVKRANDAQRAKEEQWDYIEKDPFAEVQTQLSASRPPTPRNYPGSWSTTSDYPSRALNQRREGTVSFTLTVDAGGLVTKCEVTSSSGHTDLDQATCANVSRRARFNPATDESAKPTPGTYSNRVTWRIPDDQPTEEPRSPVEIILPKQ